MNISRKDIIDYVDSYETLGFKLNKNDVYDTSKSYKDVRIAPYIDGRYVAQMNLSNLTTKEIDSLYQYQVKNANSTQVLRDLASAYTFLLNVFNSGSKDEFDKQTVEMIRELNAAKNNTTSNSNRSSGYTSENTNNNVNNNNNNNGGERVVYVDNSQSAANTAKEGRDGISGKSLGYIVAGIVIGASILYAANNISTALKENSTAIESDKDVNNGNNISISNTVTDNVAVSDSNTVSGNSVAESESNNASENNSEENKTEENKSEENKSEENKSEENKNIHSDEMINKTVNAIYDKIQTTNPNLVAEYDKKTIEALVRYTHHSNTEIKAILNDMNSTSEEKQRWMQISNQGAYDAFKELRANGIDISMFYENLDAHDRIADLNKCCSSIVQEKNSYEDEFAAYQSMDNAVTKMDSNNFPEVIAIRAIVDETTLIPSMQLARDGAMEFGGEGEAYYNEKNSIDSSKRLNCRDIFNKVDINNQSAPLTVATFKAIDEDNNRNNLIK